MNVYKGIYMHAPSSLYIFTHIDIYIYMHERVPGHNMLAPSCIYIYTHIGIYIIIELNVYKGIYIHVPSIHTY